MYLHKDVDFLGKSHSVIPKCFVKHKKKKKSNKLKQLCYQNVAKVQAFAFLPHCDLLYE